MRRRTGSLAITAATVASLWLGAAAAQSDEPGSGSPTPVSVATIVAALDGLDALPSYRFRHEALTEAHPPRTAAWAGTISRIDGWRARLEQLVDGEPVLMTITIGDRSWLATGGSGYVEQELPSTDERDALPFEARIRDMAEVDGPVQDLGPEVIEGIPTRHLRLAGEMSDAAPEPELDGSDAYDLPVHFLDAVLDVWVAVDAGHLVRASVEGTRTVTEDLSAEPVVYRVHEGTVISHVADPANVIEPPG